MSPLDALLAPDRLVDLTQPLGPDTVLWPGSTPFAATVVADYETDGGYARADAARYSGATAADLVFQEHKVAFPGLAPDAAALLVARGVAGVGIDTLSVDPGPAEEFPVHRITLAAGLWHLECLVNLEAVPTRGAWLVAAAIPLVAGSGAPARVFAILPPAGV